MESPGRATAHIATLLPEARPVGSESGEDPAGKTRGALPELRLGRLDRQVALALPHTE